MKKLNVALVGLSFGLEFVAIYCKHPDIDKVYVVDKNEKLLNIAKERYSIPAILPYPDNVHRSCTGDVQVHPSYKVLGYRGTLSGKSLFP